MCACASPQRSQREYFNINGSVVRINQQRLEEIRGYWQNNPLNLVQLSKAPQNDLQWILDLIALTENSRNHSCTSLTLVKITPETLADFAVAERTGARTIFSPKKYLESWQIDACGTINRWRVLDDPADIEHELAVLLYALGK